MRGSTHHQPERTDRHTGDILRDLRSERGAAAVEFALVLPVLLLLVLGGVEFSRAYQTQATLVAAAREGVRILAIEDDAAAARAAVRTASAVLNPAVSDADIGVTPVPCDAGNATVRIAYRLPYLTGFFGDGIDLSAEGVMRCHG